MPKLVLEDDQMEDDFSVVDIKELQGPSSCQEAIRMGQCQIRNCEGGSCETCIFEQD